MAMAPARVPRAATKIKQDIMTPKTIMFLPLRPNTCMTVETMLCATPVTFRISPTPAPSIMISPMMVIWSANDSPSIVPISMAPILEMMIPEITATTVATTMSIPRIASTA